MYRPMTKRRADELLDQARRDHRARMTDEMTPTWRETLKVALMALALMLALALLMIVGSD